MTIKYRMITLQLKYYFSVRNCKRDGESMNSNPLQLAKGEYMGISGKSSGDFILIVKVGCPIKGKNIETCQQLST